MADRSSMNTQKKILSIIIPMYNAQETIQKCLDSLLVKKQSMEHMEVLIINDGSEDRSEEIVRKYVRQYPDYFRLICQKNGGHGAAADCGLRLCRGKYFKILDADDRMVKRNLEKMAEVLFHIPDADLVLSGYAVYDDKTHTAEKFVPMCLKMPQTTNPAETMETAAVMEAAEAMETAAMIGTAEAVETAAVMITMETVLKQWGRWKCLFAFHGLMYRTDFYRRLGYRLPRKVAYDDAFYSAVPASFAKKICAVNLVLYQYNTGNETQSTSLSNRVRRQCDLEHVLMEICRCTDGKSAHSRKTVRGGKFTQDGKPARSGKSTRDEKAIRTAVGQEYLYRRLESYTTDYFVTAHLRMPDRQIGRAAAKDFYDKLKNIDLRLYRRIRKKYLLLYAMNRLYMDEKHFLVLLKYRKAFFRYIHAAENMWAGWMSQLRPKNGAVKHRC